MNYSAVQSVVEVWKNGESGECLALISHTEKRESIPGRGNSGARPGTAKAVGVFEDLGETMQLGSGL